MTLCNWHAGDPPPLQRQIRSRGHRGLIRAARPHVVPCGVNAPTVLPAVPSTDVAMSSVTAPPSAQPNDALFTTSKLPRLLSLARGRLVLLRLGTASSALSRGRAPPLYVARQARATINSPTLLALCRMAKTQRILPALPGKTDKKGAGNDGKNSSHFSSKLCKRYKHLSESKI